MKKILLLALVVIVVLGGFRYFMSQGVATGVASDWKTYKGAERYEIQYPITWSAKTSGNQTLLYSPKSTNEAYPYAIMITASKASYRDAMNSFLNDINPGLRTDIEHDSKSEKFNGYDAWSYTDLGTMETKTYILVNYPNMFRIAYSPSAPDLSEVQQVLGTFKFTK